MKEILGASAVVAVVITLLVHFAGSDFSALTLVLPGFASSLSVVQLLFVDGLIYFGLFAGLFGGISAVFAGDD